MKKKEPVGISCSPTEVYEKALKKWGYQSQWGMLIEEMGELMQVLNKYERFKATVAEVQDELVDVEIMLGQMGIVFGRERIHHRKIEKINRLEKLLEK